MKKNELVTIQWLHIFSSSGFLVLANAFIVAIQVGQIILCIHTVQLYFHKLQLILGELYNVTDGEKQHVSCSSQVRTQIMWFLKSMERLNEEEYLEENV